MTGFNTKNCWQKYWLRKGSDNTIQRILGQGVIILKNIVWLASYPKSGNTWLRAIVYSALFGQMTIHELGGMIPNFAFFASQLNGGKFESPGQIRHFWEQAQSQLCQSAGNDRVLLKTHTAAGIYDVGEFPSRKYSEKAIYVVRDPRDVAVSYSSHFGLSLESAINSLINESNINFKPKGLSRGEFLSSWGNHVKSWQHVSIPVLQLRFEDLIENPAKHITKVLTFLDIKPVITIEDIVTMTSFEKLSKQERTEGFAEAGKNELFFRQGKKSQWMQFNDNNFEKLIVKFEPVMRSLGYL